MIKRIHFTLLLFFFIIPIIGYSTHVVGGVLNYTYIGGSSYVITLKLYRDCGSGTAAAPTSVLIDVVDQFGNAFSPSKDISINLTSITQLNSTLDPCAVAPNPLPCVQEAIYTKTVTNLPAVAGGYHMYYTICCRNNSILNITNPGGTSETFYAHIPGITSYPIWTEDFTLANGTTTDNGATGWSMTNGSTAPSTSGVNNNQYQVSGANNASNVWSSQLISLGTCTNVSLSVNLSESGSLDANDSIKVYYSLNGGPLTLFPTNGSIVDDFGSAVATATNLSGSNIQIVIRTKFDGNSPNTEQYLFDNVNITCTPSAMILNSNPVFSLFPPLFICANQPFTFNHGATDADGDSLAYSFYTPYNNGTPVISGNTASFTPVTYSGGYNSTNPLGGPISINSSTGLLSGTPSTVGQFVVGVVVKEYRNGVFIGETLRDFQFNVLNCPQPPPTLAVSNATINNGCNVQPTATGITSVSATWTSIFPGSQGAYSNYLGCTSGCLTNTINPVGVPPPFVDFKVCGSSTSCAGNMICDTFRIYFNSALSVNVQPSNPVLCFGQTATTITAIGVGGTPPYSYLWNNVNPSQTINVGAGTYNVQLADGSGCPPVFQAITVTAYTAATTAFAGTNQTKCKQKPLATLNGSITGASSAVWSGGSGTFSPNNTTISNLTYSPSPSELLAGSVTLSLTTTGSTVCPSAVSTVTITYVNFNGAITTSVTNPSCFGSNNGSATVSVTGGFTPYTYTWSTTPTQSTTSVSNLSIGNYTATITDAIGCIQQTVVTITQPPVLAINSTFTNVSCFNGNNGGISTSVVGGTSPYSYSWTPGGQTTSSLLNITAGNYSLSVIDARGCSRTATFSITQPSTLTIALTQSNVSCFNGNNGAVNVITTGGTTPYTHNWLPNGATGPNVSGLTAGNYTVNVIDNNNCTVTSTLAIIQPTLLLAVTSVTNETCNYLNNGVASVSVTGGTAPYTYSWTPGALTNSVISSLTSGNYNVNVTDAKGCVITSNATINEPIVLTVGLSSQVNVSCFGGNNGSVYASPNGGTPGYSYSWSPSGSTPAQLTNATIGTYTVRVIDNYSCVATNTVVITQPSSITVTSSITNVSCNSGNNGSISLTTSGGVLPYSYFWSVGGQTTNSITGLTSGNYPVTITDANGCSKSLTLTVTQPSSITIVTTQTNVSCFGGNNGVATATVTGGTPNYTYSWQPNGQTTSVINNLTSGTYTVNIKDNFNCTLSQIVTINQPTQLAASISSTNETCNYLNNGLASVVATGGTAGYTYSWSPGGQTVSAVSGLASGTYSVKITDAFLCNITKTLTITEPSTLTVTFGSQVNVSCFGGTNGSVYANPNGGTPNYSYSWSPSGITSSQLTNALAGTYTVTVTDNNNCVSNKTVTINQPPTIIVATASVINVSCKDGNNGVATVSVTGGVLPYTYFWQIGGQTTSSVSNLVAGVYPVIVTDANSCVKSHTVTITEPTALLVNFTQTNVSCFSGTNAAISTTASGGTIPYTYTWTPNNINTPNISGLAIGTYTLIVKDNLNCIKVNTVTITQPTQLVATTSFTNETCSYLNNGSANVVGSGGTASYSYSWQPSGQTTQLISNQASGTYTAIVKDNNGCVITKTVTINQPTAVTATFNNQVNVSCFGGSDGSVNALVSGGTPNYAYSWSPNPSTNNSIYNVAAGIHTLIVTDNNNCVFQHTVAISQPTSAVSVTASSFSASCNSTPSGSLTANASGGTPAYTYTWLPINVVGQSVNNVVSGTYTIAATDSKGCVKTNTVFVNQSTPIVAVISTTNAICNSSNGVASVTASGGNGPYTYTWIPTGATTTIQTGFASGSYTVKVKDNNGCITSQQFNVNNSGGPVITIYSVTNVSCFGGSDGVATASVTGGSGVLTFTWLPFGGNSLVATGLTAGAYQITVTDANGCQALATTNPVITEPQALSINVPTSPVSCFGGSNGTATVSITGGTPSYSVAWLPSTANSTVVTNLSAGTHTVQITDSHNCIKTATYAVAQPTAPLTIAVTATAVSCFGGNNGVVASQATGGTIPYNFNWQPGNFSSQNLSGLSAGIYTVMVADNRSCTATSTVSVNEPPLVNLTTSSVNSNCELANGQASVSASGGVGGFTYTWSPTGGSASNAINLLAGNYQVIVTDANNCAQTATQVVLNNPTQTLSIISYTNVNCNGGSDAAITATVVGGMGPFTYTWLPSGGNSSTASGLPVGSYTLKTTSFNGCLASIVSTLITEPTLMFSNIGTTPVSCFGGSNGTATISVGGGVPGYTYTWLSDGSSGTTVSGLSAGIHSVTAIDSHNCLQTFTFSISQPTAPLIASGTNTDVTCFGGNNGVVSVTATGGTANYSYSWMPGNLSSQQISGLIAGTYTATVTDSKNCISTTIVTVNQPTDIVLTPSSINSNCSLANGQASVAAVGGTGAYTYTWTPNGGLSNTAINLLAGNYSVHVLDANNCPKTTSVSVIDNPSPILTIIGTTSVSCFGGNNGTATATVTGGTLPFTYTWLPTGGNTSIGNNLSTGIYTLNITSGNGCLVSVVTPSITQATQQFANINSTPVSCFGGSNGSATITAGGGTPTYTYSWLTTSTSGNTVSGLSAGIHSVSILDNNSCILTQTFAVSQPTAPVTPVTNASPVLCFGGNTGSASVTATGGTSPYNFNWQPLNVNSTSISGLYTGIYSVTATDSKNCSTTATVLVSQPSQSLHATTNSVPTICYGGSDGTATVTPIGGTAGYTYTWSPITATTSAIYNLSPGIYYVEVTDANNCKYNTQVIISTPAPLYNTLTYIDAACGLPKGSIASQVSGGQGPYTYSWSPSISATTSTLGNLFPGTYTLYATDFYGCTKSATATLIDIPSPSVAVVSTTNIGCFAEANGGADISISQGTLPYSIGWLPYGGNTTTATGLTANIYSATVVDGRGCVVTVTANITEPNLLSINSSTIKNVSCFGENDGEIVINVNGGTPVYSYTWLPTSIGTGTAITNLTNGTYTVLIEDSHFCKTSAAITVTQPTAPLTSVINNVVNLLCHTSLGAATANPSGGTVPYTYTWSSTPPQNTSNASNLLAGTYTVDIADANGCVTSNTLLLTQPTPVIGTAGLNDTICLGQTALLTCTATGGAGNYYFVWQPGTITNSGTLTPTPLANTVYTVVAFDQNGCASPPDFADVTVHVLSTANVQVFGNTPVCPGQPSFLQANVIGNTGAVTYTWSNGLTGPGIHIVIPPQPMYYYVTVANSCGLTHKDSIFIDFYPLPNVLAITNGTTVCVPYSMQFLDNSTLVSQNDYINGWTWDFGDGNSSNEQNPLHAYATPGTYTITLTVTTDAGCSNNNNSTPVILNAYPSPSAQFSINATALNLPYDKLICTNQSSGATSYQWSFGDGNTSNEVHPYYLYNTVGNYEIQLVATSLEGCTDTAYANVITGADVVFPNAFTPNPDGSSGGYYTLGSLDNDIFFPYTSGVVDYKLQIFNRWGELIFETTDIKQGWDGYYRGEISQLGVYVWKAYVKLNVGKEYRLTGDVTLLR